MLTTLGFPLFNAVGLSTGTNEDEELFFCKGSEADGRAIYTNEGLVVLKGSSGRIKNVDSIQGTGDEKNRKKLIDLGVMVEKDGRLVFVKDHAFDSPSMAGLALMGRSNNGWRAWKSKDGKTLEELKRKPAD